MRPKCVSPVGHGDAVEGREAQNEPSCQHPAQEGCWLPGDPSTQRHEVGAGSPTLSGNRVVGRSQERPEQLLRGPMPEATAGEVLREASVWYKWGIYEETPILRGEGGPGGAGQG